MLVKEERKAQIHQSMASVALLARDFARGYNRDWVR
jgi:hypothetical protein